MTSTTMASDLAQEALRPFAAVGRWLSLEWRDNDDTWPAALAGHDFAAAPSCPTVGDLRRARRAYDAIGSGPANVDYEWEAKTAWNCQADDANQWDSLGADEKEGLKAVVAFAIGRGRSFARGDAIGSGGKVRALEWDEHGRAKALGLRYEVWLHRDVADGYKERWLAARINGATDRLGGFDSRDEAKAAAQADFERRVLSCLSPVAVEEADAKAGGDLYLIRKGGAYYRPNSQGYTRLAEEAGRYTLEEAEAITHPNGPHGPRDGMDYVPGPSTPSPQIGKAGAGPVGEPVAWQCRLSAHGAMDEGWHMISKEVAAYVAEHGYRAGQPHLTCEVRPLYARPVEEPCEVERQRGWIYFNPDAGTEWAENHPVESGEVPDAEDIRPGSSGELLKQLLPAWRELATETSRRETAEGALAETRERLEKLEAALRFYAWENEQRLPSEGPWGINSTDFGKIARAALTGDAQEAGK